MWDNLRLCGTLHLLHIRNKVVNCEQSLVFKSLDFVSGLHNCLEFSQHPHVTLMFILRTGHYLSPGGAGDLGLNKVKFSRSPFWMLPNWSDPRNNFWWLLRCPSPQCLYFPSKFKWSPLWILPKFSLIPPFGFSVTTDPAFVLLKIKWSPPNPPHLLAINNDRSLRLCKPWILQLGKNLHNLCFSFILGILVIPREVKTVLMENFFSGGEVGEQSRYILGNRNWVWKWWIA